MSSEECSFSLVNDDSNNKDEEFGEIINIRSLKFDGISLLHIEHSESIESQEASFEPVHEGNKTDTDTDSLLHEPPPISPQSYFNVPIHSILEKREIAENEGSLTSLYQVPKPDFNLVDKEDTVEDLQGNIEEEEDTLTNVTTGEVSDGEKKTNTNHSLSNSLLFSLCDAPSDCVSHQENSVQELHNLPSTQLEDNVAQPELELLNIDIVEKIETLPDEVTTEEDDDAKFGDFVEPLEDCTPGTVRSCVPSSVQEVLVSIGAMLYNVEDLRQLLSKLQNVDMAYVIQGSPCEITNMKIMFMKDTCKFLENTDPVEVVIQQTATNFKNNWVYKDLFGGLSWMACFRQFLAFVLEVLIGGAGSNLTLKKTIKGKFQDLFYSFTLEKTVCRLCGFVVKETRSKRCHIPLQMQEGRKIDFESLMSRNFSLQTEDECDQCNGGLLEKSVTLLKAARCLFFYLNRENEEKLGDWINTQVHVDEAYVIPVNDKKDLYVLRAVIDWHSNAENHNTFPFKTLLEQRWKRIMPSQTVNVAEYDIIGSRSFFLKLEYF